MCISAIIRAWDRDSESRPLPNNGVQEFDEMIRNGNLFLFKTVICLIIVSIVYNFSPGSLIFTVLVNTKLPWLKVYTIDTSIKKRFSAMV